MRLIDLPLGSVRVLGFAFLLLCLGAVLCALYAVGKPKTLPYKIICAVLALLAFWPEWMIEIYSVYMHDLADYASPVPSWAEPTLSLPAWAFRLLVLLLLAAEAALALRLVRLSHRTLSARSVCEGFDQLPDGICFSLRDGFPRLVNDRMQSISHAAFGENIANAERLNRRLEKRDLQPGCSVDEDERNTFLLLPDATAWRLKQKPMIVDKKDMTETVAFDTTERYRALNELRKRNARLEQVNRQLRDYMQQMDHIMREREILRAKIMLHDELGNILLAIRNYLSQPGGDRKALVDLILTETKVLQTQNVPDRSDDPLFAVEQAAKMIGAAIHYEGVLPKLHREVVVVAIHECLTNAVKHAGGKNLFVRVAQTDGQTVVSLTNDGDPPAGPVRETGGLGDLRRLAEQNGVEMQIESAPVFRLQLKFEF